MRSKAGWIILLFQICSFILDHQKTTITNFEKCFPLFLKERRCWGQAVGSVNEHKIKKSQACNTDFERDRRTVLFCNKKTLTKAFHYYLLNKENKSPQLLLLKAFQASPNFTVTHKSRLQATCANH